MEVFWTLPAQIVCDETFYLNFERYERDDLK